MLGLRLHIDLAAVPVMPLWRIVMYQPHRNLFTSGRGWIHRIVRIAILLEELVILLPGLRDFSAVFLPLKPELSTLGNIVAVMTMPAAEPTVPVRRIGLILRIQGPRPCCPRASRAKAFREVQSLE